MTQSLRAWPEGPDQTRLRGGRVTREELQWKKRGLTLPIGVE